MKLKFSTNIYLATLYQLAVALVMLSLCRFFFYLYNTDIFPDISSGGLLRIFAGGVRFDLTALLYLNAVFILLRILPFRFTENRTYLKWTDGVYYACNSVGILFNLIDTPYFRFTNTRMSQTSLTEFLGDTNAAGIVGGHLKTYWPLLFVGAAFLFLLIWLYQRAEIRPLHREPGRFPVLRILIVPVVAVLMLAGIRGGLYKGVPLSINDAIRYTEHNRDINLVLNTPFNIMRSLGKKMDVEKYDFLPQEKIDAIYNPVYPARENAVLQKKNVMIVILEGIGSAFIDSINTLRGDSIPANGLTPFLNSLCEKSYVFTNAYASGRRSSEGINAVLGGFPAYVPLVYMNSPYNHNDIDGLPTLLRKEGYESVFYLGCNKGSYAFESFSKAAGYQRFVGRDEYGNDADYDGTWGIFDDKMADFIAADLSQMPEPFVAAWFTLSSHGPYTLPEAYKGRYKSPDRTMYQMVEYVDEVLRDFFRDIEQEPWYENTLFVLTSDHAFYMNNPIYNSPNTLYKIPLLFYAPDGSIAPGRDERVASQIDITPTVLGLLNYPGAHVSLGSDLFDPQKPNFAISYVGELYQLNQGDYMLQMDKTGNVVALYNRIKDPLLHQNILEENPETAADMELLLKAFLQEYSHRLHENRLSL